ncbi:MAG TPA: hypothetical protein VGA78_13650 [Gemmatimonadales bacterium]
MVAPILAAALLCVAALPVSAQRRNQPQESKPVFDPAWYSQLKLRHIGPEGNRVSAVAGVPGDPLVYYAGAASGGIFKSSDGGVRWEPIFDSQPVSSVGAIAVAPSDHSVVWVGTGEPFIRSNISLGWGVFRSTDAGKTWSRAGLELTGRIGRIAVDPRNPDVVLVAALGHGYGPQPERGVYRTADGGKTWDRTLFVNDSTGAIDVMMNPVNPRIAYAATWQLNIHTAGRTSGGAGSGLWKSTDGGITWSRLTGSGLPAKPFGKVGLGISRSNPNRVYALIETSDGVPFPGFEPERGELWRSDDAGATWQVVSYDRQLAGRTQYYTRMAVAPDNENEAYFAAADWSRTYDGGKTTIDATGIETPGYDHHDIWIDPANGNRMAVGHDGGISISWNRGRSWHQVQLPIAQMYHVTVDNQIPYYVYGNRQDGNSARGPSNSKFSVFGSESGIPRGEWRSVGGGESGWATPDPEDPNLVWSSASGFGSLGGIVARHDLRTGMTHNVEVWPMMTRGWPAADLKYRFYWTFPLTISPHDRNRVYVGSQHVHLTIDGGRSWRELSPDLTRNEKTRQVSSGGLTPDNIGVEYAGVVMAIAESRLKAGVIWAGTNDGLVHLSQDGGSSWTNLTANITGLLPWGTISNIEPSRFEAGAAYLTVDGHQVNNRDPWAYRTSDFGKTWKLIVNGIPKTPLSYAHFVKEDPVRRGLLYLGTENALYLSFDDGDNWQPLQNNLPHAPVHGIALQEHFSDLVLATYGRGFWILDDVTPLRQLHPTLTSQDAALFAPRPAYRLRQVEPAWSPLYDPAAGANPPYGASLQYWLKAEEKDTVRLEIVDRSGTVVRKLTGTGQAGINRVWWDLRFDPPKAAKLRTPPLHAPEITVTAEGRASFDQFPLTLLAPPGNYSIRLKTGGKEYSQALELRKDPNSGGSDAEITQQMELLRQISGDLQAAVEMINALENIRHQLAALRITLSDDTARAAVRNDADSLNQKAIAVEQELVELRLTGRGQDLIRYPVRIAGRLAYLGGDLGGSDYAPTAQHRAVHSELRSQLEAVRRRFDEFLARDVAAFNAVLAQRGMNGIFR